MALSYIMNFAVFAQTPNHKISKGNFHLDLKKLPLVPEGLFLGMSVVDLRELRPNVKSRSDIFSNAKKPNSFKEEDILTERDRQGEVGFAATYIIKDSKLDSISIAQRYKPEIFAEKRKEIVKEYINELGAEAERKVRVVKGTDFDFWEPCLWWKTEKFSIAISVMPDFSEVVPHVGQIHIFLLTDQSLIEQSITNYQPTVHKNLFSTLESILEESRSK